MINKRCSKCELIKPVNEFPKNKDGLGGFYSVCKECISIRLLKRNRSREGFIKMLYERQKKNCKKRHAEPPKYSFDEFKKWILSQKIFNKLFNNWKNSDYNKDLIPSVDRINDYISYTIDNIQLMTWKENANKYNSDKKNGINTKQCKEVLQYDLCGNFIKKHHSIMQAYRETGVDNSSISKVCKGKIKQCNGFIWKFKN